MPTSVVIVLTTVPSADAGATIMGDGRVALILDVGSLVRHARRMAEQSRAPWTVLHIQSARDVRLSAADHARIAETIRLAERLGAETVTVPGDDIAAEAVARPVTFGDVYATLFRHLGIDAATTLVDNQGRPQYLADDGGTPIATLFG